MPDETIVLTVRIEPRDVEFLDTIAEKLCNTRVGVIRYAIRNLQSALSRGDRPEHPENDQQEGLPCA